MTKLLGRFLPEKYAALRNDLRYLGLFSDFWLAFFVIAGPWLGLAVAEKIVAAVLLIVIFDAGLLLAGVFVALNMMPRGEGIKSDHFLTALNFAILPPVFMMLTGIFVSDRAWNDTLTLQLLFLPVLAHVWTPYNAVLFEWSPRTIFKLLVDFVPRGLLAVMCFSYFIAFYPPSGAGGFAEWVSSFCRARPVVSGYLLLLVVWQALEAPRNRLLRLED